MRIYFTGSLVAMACAAGRYMVFARILGPHQLGLAAILILTTSFLDTVTDTGSDRFLVQDSDAGEPSTLAMVHLVLVLRGVILTTVLAGGSTLIAAFYNTPTLQIAFVALAAYPLIFGFQNADFRRQQRDHDFRSEGLCTTTAELAAIGAAVWSAFALRNVYCVVVTFVVRALVFVIASHLTARAPYRVKYSRPVAIKLGKFGGPLMLSGVSLFFGLQGDRVVIANRLSATELGLYSAVSLLAFYPVSVVSRILMGIQIPLVARARLAPATEGAVLEGVAGDTTLLSLAAAAGFFIVTPLVLVPMYGARFAQSLPVIALVGVLQAWRLLRTWPTTIALGIGRSVSVMASTTARLVALPLSLGAVALGFGLVGIIWSFIFGELVACVVNLVMVNSALSRKILADFDRVGLMLGATAILFAASIAKGGLEIGLISAAALALAAVTFVRERANIARWTALAAGFAGTVRRRLPGRLRPST
jgi:O-antigen/teichoic acid export membrane protein